MGRQTVSNPHVHCDRCGTEGDYSIGSGIRGDWMRLERIGLANRREEVVVGSVKIDKLLCPPCGDIVNAGLAGNTRSATTED